MRPVTWLKLFKPAPLEWSPEPVCCCPGGEWINAGCKLHGIYPAQRAAEQAAVPWRDRKAA